MKRKLNAMLALVCAIALSGCADVVKLADPATDYNTIEACENREAILARVSVAKVAADVVGTAADAVLAPVVGVYQLFAGVKDNAYTHTTAVRNQKCAELLRQARPRDPPPPESSE